MKIRLANLVQTSTTSYSRNQSAVSGRWTKIYSLFVPFLHFVQRKYNCTKALTYRFDRLYTYLRIWNYVIDL